MLGNRGQEKAPERSGPLSALALPLAAKELTRLFPKLGLAHRSQLGPTDLTELTA